MFSASEEALSQTPRILGGNGECFTTHHLEDCKLVVTVSPGVENRLVDIVGLSWPWDE